MKEWNKQAHFLWQVVVGNIEIWRRIKHGTAMLLIINLLLIIIYLNLC